MDILIICEENNKIFKTLSSIDMQDFLDGVSVYIIGTPNKKDEDIIEYYSTRYNIKLIKASNEEKSGVKFQKAYDTSKSEYVMFMYSGDVLCDVYSLSKLNNELTGEDIICGKILAGENIDVGLKTRISNILLGEVFKRKFIDAKKISFDDKNDKGEIFFGKIAFSLSDKIKYVDIDLHNTTRDSLSIEDLIAYSNNMKTVMDSLTKKKVNRKMISKICIETMATIFYAYAQTKYDITKIKDACYENYKQYLKYGDEFNEYEKYQIVYNCFEIADLEYKFSDFIKEFEK